MVCVSSTGTELSPGLRDSKCIDGIDFYFRANLMLIQKIYRSKVL